MAKNKCEIQKGPINLDEQFTQGFRTKAQTLVKDNADMMGRRSGQTLTLHQPKR